MEVRRLGPDEWTTLRALRLAALQDSPDSFWSTYEEEASRADEWWRASPDRVAWFVTFVDGDPVGLAGGLRAPDLADTERHLIGMWVDPSARGRGLGTRLVEAVKQWARNDGAETLQLEVAESNEPARRLYERCGFRRTGRTQRLPRKPSIIEHEMRAKL